MDKRFLKMMAFKLKRASPIILSIVSSVGVVATTVIAVKDTPKALKLIEDKKCETKGEVVKATWKCYIPTAIVGVTTIGCIIASNVLGVKNQAALASAYALVAKNYKTYRDKVKELYGETAHEEIMSSIACDTMRTPKDWSIGTAGGFRNSSTTFDGADEEEKEFFDVYSNRHFVSTLSKVLAAEYQFNRYFQENGLIAELDVFYEFLGIEPIGSDLVIGYNCEEDITWIDFNNYVGTLDDGMQIHFVEIMADFHPESYYEQFA